MKLTTPDPGELLHRLDGPRKKLKPGEAVTFEHRGFRVTVKAMRPETFEAKFPKDSARGWRVPTEPGPGGDLWEMPG
ncbi:MAG: hypothetical protein ACOZIN_18455 [Myxococcota bacterium]